MSTDRAKELLAAEPKDAPASDELCRELGIDPSGALDFVQSAGKKPAVKNVGRSKSKVHNPPPFFEDKPRISRRALSFTSGEEALSVVLRSLMEYLDGRDPSWWNRPTMQRRSEVDFVADSIINLYDDFRETET